MKNRIIILFFLFSLAASFASAYEPLSEKWSSPIRSDEVYLIDLDKDGLLEAYPVSYGERSACIHAVSYGGEVFWGECFTGFSRLYYAKASEEYSSIYLADLWNDGVLDVLAGSNIRGGGANVQKFYLIQRQKVPGTSRFEYELQWDYLPGNVVTDIAVAGAFNESVSDFVFSSIDSYVYVLGQNTAVKAKASFVDAVWCVHALDVDGDSAMEIAAGALSGVYLVECGRSSPKVPGTCNATLMQSTPSRVLNVFAADVGGGDYVIAAATEDVVYVVGAGGGLRWSTQLAGIRDLWVKDIDNDGSVEVLVVSADSIRAFDKDGRVKWTQFFDDRLLSITVDVYDNIFLGSETKLYHLVANQDYTLDKSGWATYNLAYEQYTQRKYNESRHNALRARRMFEMVGDLEGVAKCDFLLAVTDEHAIAEDVKFKADEYYKQASELFAAGFYREASYNASTALSIYLEVGERENAIKCDMLLFEINKAQNAAKRSQAEADYSAASSSFAGLMYPQAAKQAEAALAGFDYLNDSMRSAESEALLAKIRLAEKSQRAGAAYNKSVASIASGDYDSAIASAEDARGVYIEIGDSKKVAECDILLDSAEKHIEARSYYSMAVGEFEASRLDNASAFAEKAKAVYVGLGESNKAKECDSLLSKINGAKTGALWNYAVLAAAVVAVAAVLVLARRKKVV